MSTLHSDRHTAQLYTYKALYSCPPHWFVYPARKDRSRRMATLDFSSFEMRHVETGALLYTTTATIAEILEANKKLAQHSMNVRFYKAGSFSIPDLHKA